MGNTPTILSLFATIIVTIRMFIKHLHGRRNSECIFLLFYHDYQPGSWNFSI